MSKTSDIYDQIVATIQATYSTKSELANPYSVEDNADTFLDDGFGVALGSAVSDEPVNVFLPQTRIFNILLTKKIFATENSISARKEVERAIMNEGVNIIEQLKLNDDLRVDALSVQMVGDDGINLSESDRQSFVYTNFSVEIYYRETINNF